jgi:hypothetical protein
VAFQILLCVACCGIVSGQFPVWGSGGVGWSHWFVLFVLFVLRTVEGIFMGRFVVWSAVGGNFGFLLWLRQSDGLVKVPLGDQCLWGISASGG